MAYTESMTDLRRHGKKEIPRSRSCFHLEDLALAAEDAFDRFPLKFGVENGASMPEVAKIQFELFDVCDLIVVVMPNADKVAPGSSRLLVYPCSLKLLGRSGGVW